MWKQHYESVVTDRLVKKVNEKIEKTSIQKFVIFRLFTQVSQTILYKLAIDHLGGCQNFSLQQQNQNACGANFL